MAKPEARNLGRAGPRLNAEVRQVQVKYSGGALISFGSNDLC